MTEANNTINATPSETDENEIEERAAILAYIREHPHLSQTSPVWQKWYYRVRKAVLKEQ